MTASFRATRQKMQSIKVFYLIIDVMSLHLFYDMKHIYNLPNIYVFVLKTK